MKWVCADCGRQNHVDSSRCACGYKATQYDLAASAEDTGRYLVNRISVPSIETLVEKQAAGYIRISKIIIIMMLSGALLISIVMLIFKLIYR